MAQANHALNLIRTLGAPPSVPPSTPRRHRADVLCFQAHSELISGLATETPNRIIGSAADSIDVESRGRHLREVLKATARYVKTIVEDTNEHVALGTIDAAYLDNFLTDLASEVAGLFGNCARLADENRESRGGSRS